MLSTSASGERNDSFFVSDRIRFTGRCGFRGDSRRHFEGKSDLRREDISAICRNQSGAGMDILFSSVVIIKWHY